MNIVLFFPIFRLWNSRIPDDYDYWLPYFTHILNFKPLIVNLLKTAKIHTTITFKIWNII